jgi:hypothetical protein
MKLNEGRASAFAFLPSWKSLCLAGSLAISVLTVGCYEHRYYDPYYHDYHAWNDSEVVYYHRWANENHRDPNRDFRHISKDEQKEYWTWRHNQH